MNVLTMCQKWRPRGVSALTTARAISHSMFFRLIQSIPLPGKWQHCRDSLKLHFDGHSGLSLPLTSVVKLWPPGHFGGALSVPAKCRESDGRTKEMICGQTSTLMVLTLHADHIVAAEYIVEMGRVGLASNLTGKMENIEDKSCWIFERYPAAILQIISTVF